jgi:Tol biopolymer transport system component/DNA-binding winged helix-turn-helix (wHTH) protein
MSGSDGRVLRFDRYEIDLDRKVLWVDGSIAELPVKSVEVLASLIQRSGQVVTKDVLIDEAWTDAFVEDGVLTQNVYLLRRFFSAHGTENLIQTIPRRGYRFTGVVEEDFAGEVIIERKTVERRFVSQIDVSDESRSTETRGRSGFWRPAYYLTAASIVAVVLLTGAFIYNGRGSQSNSSDSLNRLEYQRLSSSARAYQIGLSKDGTYAAYSVFTPEGRYQLLLHHLPTGSETTLIQHGESTFESLNFSPDGNYIYYLGRGNGKHLGVYRIPILGKTPELITREPLDFFSVSPDGRWLAYYRRVDGPAHVIEICRSDNGGDRRIVTTRGGMDFFSIWGVAPAWSPDGRKFVASAFSREVAGGPATNFLVEIDVATGDQTRINGPDWHRINQPYWSADGNGIYALASEKIGDPLQIWSLEYPSGVARNITKDDNDYRQFNVTADAASLVAISWIRSENLFLLPLEDPSRMRQLTFDSGSVNGSAALKWTTDGKSLIFSRGKALATSNLFAIDKETLVMRQLTNDANSYQNYADVTPDGRSVIYASNRNGFWNIWQSSLDGGEPRQLTFGKGEVAPEISPDGSWLYYVGEGLWKMPLGGGEAVRVWDRKPGTTRVSPVDSSRMVSYIHDQNEKLKNPWMFVTYRAEDPQQYKNLEIDAVIHFEWKPDGSGIYFADSGEGFNNLWFVSINDLKKQKLTDFTDQRMINMSLSPDGTTLAVSRGTQTGSAVKISGILP